MENAQRGLEAPIEAYLTSGNNIPVTRATIPWPGVGMVVVDCLFKRVAQRDENKKDLA